MFSYDFVTVEYGYFNTGSIIETEKGSYTDGSESLELESVSWNHSLPDVLTALKMNGIEIEIFREFEYSPHDCFKNTDKVDPNRLSGKQTTLGLCVKRSKTLSLI